PADLAEADMVAGEAAFVDAAVGPPHHHQPDIVIGPDPPAPHRPVTDLDEARRGRLRRGRRREEERGGEPPAWPGAPTHSENGAPAISSRTEPRSTLGLTSRQSP